MSLRRSIIIRSSIAWYLLLASCVALNTHESTIGPGRIVAVGDVHGNFDGLADILKRTALIDEQNRWIGKDAVLVQTGDILDRGNEVQKIMDLLMKLQDEAPRSGGKVIVLLGNHEMMNISRQYNDVSAGAFSSFRQGTDEDATGDDSAAYKQSLGPDGRYGKWLRTLNVMAVVGDTMFVHGGISPAMAKERRRNLNADAKEEIATFDRAWENLVSTGIIDRETTLETLQADFENSFSKDELSDSSKEKGTRAMSDLANLLKQGILFREDGPIWYRGFATLSDERLDDYLPDYLDKQRVKRVVAGHNVQEEGFIKARLADRVFLIDTGMLSKVYRGGQASALEIQHGQVTAVYPGKRIVMVASLVHTANNKAPAHGWSERRWLDPNGDPLPFTNNQEAQIFLNTAGIVNESDIPEGITKPKKILLQKEGIQAHAVFRYYHTSEGKGRVSSRVGKSRNFRDSYRNEMAAYELNLLLGMGTLPPTVVRNIDAMPGSLQLWVEETMTDADRIRQKKTPPNVPHWDRQFWDMRVFDNLINNADRNNGNILIDEQWRIWLIDHTRTFAKDITLPNPHKVERVSRQLWQALNHLDKDVVREKLKPHLEASEVSALFARLRKLTTLINRRIKKLGEDAVIFNHEHCCDH